jgi:hypothetical protein
MKGTLFKNQILNLTVVLALLTRCGISDADPNGQQDAQTHHLQSDTNH